jgi:hypothetical protein
MGNGGTGDRLLTTLYGRRSCRRRGFYAHGMGPFGGWIACESPESM